MTVAEFPWVSTAFRLHVGSGDPPGAMNLAPPDSSDKVATNDDERASLVAAFNGGFKRDAGAGGMVVDEFVVSTLSNGFATAVINGKGHLDVGVWGRDLPRKGEKVIAARQNLSLLVDAGRATALAGQGAGPWGAVLGSNPVVARSAVGVDGSGNVFYAGTTMALPSDLADVMVQLGVVRAMQLDINPSWVTLGIAASPGGAMTGIVPGQYHDPSIFLNGWERDFVTVLAQPRPGCRLVFASPAGVPVADPTIVRCGNPHLRPSRELATAP